MKNYKIPNNLRFDVSYNFIEKGIHQLNNKPATTFFLIQEMNNVIGGIFLKFHNAEATVAHSYAISYSTLVPVSSFIFSYPVSSLPLICFVFHHVFSHPLYPYGHKWPPVLISSFRKVLIRERVVFRFMVGSSIVKYVSSSFCRFFFVCLSTLEWYFLPYKN